MENAVCSGASESFDSRVCNHTPTRVRPLDVEGSRRSPRVSLLTHSPQQRNETPHSTLLVSGAQELPDSVKGSLVDSVTADSTAVDSADSAKVLIDNSTKIFLSDSKERQNEQRKKDKDKEAGIVREVKKRNTFVEDHSDDCGESLDSISTDLDGDACHLVDSSDDTEWDQEDPLVENLELSHLWGGEAPVYNPLENLSLCSFTDFEQTLAVLKCKGQGLDLAEICGGEARTTQIGIRRHLKCGSNFDLVTNFDLTVKHQRMRAWQYFEQNTVLCVIMAPVCGPYGPMSNLNWSLYPETMRLKELAVRPLAQFCGLVALLQLGKDLHFIQEQPYPSRLYDVMPWPKVMRYQEVVQVVYDRCAAGLKVLNGKFKGLFLKKPSTMTASDPELVKPFQDLRCKQKHEHLSGDGHPKELSEAQVWTWEEANRIIAGIINLRKKLRSKSYPVQTRENIKWPQPGAVKNDPSLTRYSSECKACKAGWPDNHFEHSRVAGKCRYPGQEPWVPDCEACLKGKHIDCPNPAHSLDDKCWWGGRQSRQSAPRTGKHPRDPAIKASSDPTAKLSGSPGGEELGAEGEEEIEERIARQGASAASSTEAPPMEEGSEPLPMRRRKDQPKGHRSTVVPPKKEDRSAELGGDGPADADDWTHFDIKRVLRTLRLAEQPQCKLTLRKLHLRWWHASAKAMQNLLGRAGIPDMVLKLIPPIVPR